MNNKIKLHMAPIKGIADNIYCQMYSKNFKGFNSALAPFLSSAKQNNLKAKYLKEYPEANLDKVKLIPQILCNDADFFLSIAEGLSQNGYNEINWNLGCPSPMVINRTKGAGLLPEKENIKRFLEKTTNHKDFKISVKCRLGLSSPVEILELIPVFNKFNIKQITIHPRTAKDMFSGELNLEIFKECTRELQHKVVYSGDIFSVNDFYNLNSILVDQSEYMLGRGAVIDPLLGEKILNICDSSEDKKKERFLTFHNDLFYRYQKKLSGDKHLLEKMKSFWFYWSQNYIDSKKVMKTIKKIVSIKNYQSTVDDILSNIELVE